MKIYKPFTYSFSLLLVLSCGKGLSTRNSINASETIKSQSVPHLGENDEPLGKYQANSFVVSCGSGCAMTYIVRKIIKEKAGYTVTFSVDMYIDERLSDQYDETYSFIFDRNHKINKIVAEDTQQNVLKTLPTGARRSFLDFSQTLAAASGERQVRGHLKFSRSIIPYQQKINPAKASYKKMVAGGIKGLAEFACNHTQIRYIPFDKIGKAELILIPMDCGDAVYRYYLISIYDKAVVSSLYVEGELHEPENDVVVEKTSFKIDKNSVLTVKTENENFELGANNEKKFKVSNAAEILEIK